jgi:hypothetical protein
MNFKIKNQKLGRYPVNFSKFTVVEVKDYGQNPYRGGTNNSHYKDQIYIPAGTLRPISKILSLTNIEKK